MRMSDEAKGFDPLTFGSITIIVGIVAAVAVTFQHAEQQASIRSRLSAASDSA